MSNHAQKGQESRHNLIYWRYGDYIGIGPGAHGRVTLGGLRYATDSLLAPGAWLKAAEAGNGDKSRSLLTDEDQAVEYLMMSLRLSEGSNIERYQQLSGHALDVGALNGLTELGLIDATDTSIRATTKGRPVLNGILRELLA